MSEFQEFLRRRWEAGGLATDDVLASVLPLMREALDAHAAGFVAPLEGLQAIRVERGRLWFEQAARRPIRRNPAEVERLARREPSAVEVTAEIHRELDVDQGGATAIDRSIGESGQAILRPVYLPGYVSWEHCLEHHDPLTDVFSLGLILASLATGLDLADPQQLARFVALRRNLFALNPDLHPVLAQASARMTELDRHRRAADLATVIRSLENYREQEVDFETELARTGEFAQPDLRGKQHVVLSKLRERLFEISRRNRLLHFRATMGTVNLTHASVPLSFDVHSIRPEQILVWNDDLQEAVIRSGSLGLNRYLNFNEALYLPSVLDRIGAEARRDQAEFGFAQLRLVLCFLHWVDLKEQPPQRFESPLVLLPVELKKKKGIRDTYHLEVLDQQAEINPVIRHQFQALYGIHLPETIDVGSSRLDELFTALRRQIQASEPAVTLEKIDRPRIALLHDRARRRLDSYRHRARLAGRGVRTFLDLDYSYDPANYHPLGLTLFQSKIRPPVTHLREMVQEKPRPRSFAAPPEEPLPAEVERTFYALRSGGEDNPYLWSFDLCSVTLANFKYRKMSLVRDYEALLDQPRSNAPFEATFSLIPREPNRALPAGPPLEERYEVVPCDPTQAAAIEEAREGRSYIIQGPPGTGKSQTIANLIADFVARGKRVLFVCEKRAAIDVVYARLRQCGLAEFCCLIHDSQTDKREFVMDLKQTYEAALAAGDVPVERRSPSRSARGTSGEDAAAGEVPAESDSYPSGAGRTRDEVLQRLSGELQPLEQFDAAMRGASARSALPLRQLLDRCLQLRDCRPELSPLEREQLPPYAAWYQHRERLAGLQASIREFQPDGVLGRHSLALLSPRLAQADRPLQQITQAAEQAQQQLEQLKLLLDKSGIEREAWQTSARARELVDYARSLGELVQAGHLSLLDPNSPRAKALARDIRKLKNRRTALDEARQATRGWREKLPAEDLPAALHQARAWEGRWLAWLSPAWWRLRAILRRRYDFRAHAVRPSWTQVLGTLQAEYAAAAEADQQRQRIAQAHGIDGVDPFLARLTRIKAAVKQAPPWLREIHRQLLHGDRAEEILGWLEQAHEPLLGVETALGSIADDWADRPLEQLADDLQRMMGGLDDLPDFLRAMALLGGLPVPLQAAVRRLPLTTEALEAAMADATLQEAYRQDRSLQRFNGPARSLRVERIEQLYDSWLKANAGEVRQRVRRRFLEQIRLASLPAAQLTPEQKEFKKRYGRGRRELEHEFGKSMRYKAIRELVSQDSGEVIQDLKPVWLMSPLSVSDTLPLDNAQFDVVIFDEASQVTLEEAVPSLFRAAQTIVVGDEMQLPPTDFFSARRSEEDEELLIEEQGELVRYDLDSDSFLNHAAKNLPSTMLGWHYRSRSEALISYSNWTFYDGRLLTVPDERLIAPRGGPLKAGRSPDGDAAATALRQRPLSFHHIPHGVYEKRRNRAEADYIAHLIRGLLDQRSGLSIGVVAFSEAQQDEIENALQRLAQQDRDFGDLLDAEREREVDGQFVGLLVKNLENIQGDERDVVILSICYGRGPDGRMLMNFGPINKNGGEKRLNVAFSRAKHHMAVVSSIRSPEITNDYNDGANCLKNYLRYAQAVSEGDSQTAQRVLRGLGRWSQSDQADSEPEEPLLEQLAAALTARGLLVDRAVGQSHFQCDLAVRRPEDEQYRLGILTDGRAYYDQEEVLERDMMRPRLLRAFGWDVAFVLAKDWYEDPAAVLDRLRIQHE